MANEMMIDINFAQVDAVDEDYDRLINFISLQSFLTWSPWTS